jgi:diaminopimelate epimerase
MHGTGNDYIIIDNRDGKLGEDKILGFAKKVCERRFSVGADGLLLVCNSDNADVKMRIFNPDGTEAEMCGNGIRCFVKFCYENGITRKEKLNVETLAGIKKTYLSISDDELKTVKVDMGEPSFDRRSIPMLGEGSCINKKLKVNDKTYVITCLSVGNPHCVIFVDDVAAFAVEDCQKIEHHYAFSKRINVEFVQVLNRKEIKMRVWERGVGETLSCGTGACASVVASNILGKTDRDVLVHLLGGELKILYDRSIYMEGPSVNVYKGELFC